MKNNNFPTYKEVVKSVVEITDPKQAVILRYYGHDLYSIEKQPPLLVFNFYFRNDTLQILSDFLEGKLTIEPIRFFDCIDDLKFLAAGDEIVEYLRKQNTPKRKKA